MAIFQEWENSNTAGIVTYFTLQIALVIILFTNCYISQLLIDEGNAVKNISNTLDWYQLSVKNARSLILIIIMSNNPMKVTVANMIQLSLVTFTDVGTSNTDVYKSLRKECFMIKTSAFNYSKSPRLCAYRYSATIVKQREKICSEKLKLGFKKT
ncbi:hypothetical protein E2986_11704 [Frieseomelitta varia]|uniref:Uncharacterized protein n=1 Tax=Frieseomelitta varia TaxID=561572 RepID=A0A833VY61_9HYME|nr:hypothetical protein E2986_11704 [Frieseomelitta varia]